MKPEAITVIAGSSYRSLRGVNNPSYEKSKWQIRKGIKVVNNPEFVLHRFLNDISLLKVDSAFQFNEYVSPICLPSADYFVDDGVCTISGLGRTKLGGDVSKEEGNRLNQATVPVISNKECNSRLIHYLNTAMHKKYPADYKMVRDGHVCAGYAKGVIDTCVVIIHY